MKLDLSRHAPPGMETKEEKTLFTVGMVLSALFSLWYYGVRYSDELARLYWINGSVRTLKNGALMPDFVEILGIALIGFQIVAALSIAAAVMHYMYHFHESKSIYTMRRLPKWWEIHRRCLTLPLCALASAGLAAFLFLLGFFAVYMLVTPEICLPPDQWQKIWSVLL